MKIRRVHIQNFRCIKDLALDLDDTTVFIGENNSGKTAVLHALKRCLYELGPRRRQVFEPFDFHLADASADPTTADPIVITITFAEDAQGDWDDQLVGRLNRQKILQVLDDGRSQVTLQVTCAYSPVDRDYDQSWAFLNKDGQALTGVSGSALTTLQSEVPFFYLAALRDAARHFDAKGPFWRPFLKDSQLPADKKAEIEQRLSEVNELVVSSHVSFDQARQQLKRVQEVVPMGSGDIVSIEAVPGRMFDMLAKAQVHLSGATGAKVPVGLHGEGTQSLSVLMLFSAFLDTWPKGTPIIALEEPEAHLHPSAVRALWKVLDGIHGQKLVATHSGDLLSEVPAPSVRRLVRVNGGVGVFRLKAGTLDGKHQRQFGYHIRRARAELLFARCWLLVEGETEVTLLPEIARHLGLDLEQAGVCLVPHRHASIELFLKVAKELGIRWCVLADNDGQGVSDQQHAQNYANGAPLADVLHVMPEDDIEGHLCAAGFGAIYEAYLSPQTQGQVTVTTGHPDYWRQVLKAIKKPLVKPAAALEVAQQIQAGAMPVPPLLETTLRKAIEIAGGA